MGILKKTYPAIISLMLTGCYEDFNPDISSEPVLCLNSLITAGEPIEVAVTRTWLYTDADNTKNHKVSDASVCIYANGKQVDDDYLPQEGDNIRIIAESAAYGKAEATVTVPVSVPVGSVEWVAEITDRWGENNPEALNYIYRRIDLNAKLTINDPADTENYYQFSYEDFIEDMKQEDPHDSWINSTFEFHSGTFHDEEESIFSEHLGVIDEIIDNSSYGFSFFTDRQFSGKSYTLNLHFSDMGFGMRSSGVAEDIHGCGIILILSTVSKSYYNWCNYRWNIDNSIIGDLEDIGMGNTIWGYSNVSTGAGVVAARSRTSYAIDLKDFLKNDIFTQSITDKNTSHMISDR